MAEMTPGSDEAFNHGCTCPVIDNKRGKGAYVDESGNPVFWYTMSCPIHGNAEPIKPEVIVYEHPEH